MYAIEFRTKIKDGIIEIPKTYRDKIKNNVKVIVLTEEKKVSINMIDRLLSSPIKAEKFTPLSRREIYERY
ncbi:MAG: hypothetical protein DRH50_03570 [Deltaproteobacteria bacterium]|nr:MAG: hypothetical protein DRH50_03570 [Deltaproteobacteria bacterium]